MIKTLTIEPGQKLTNEQLKEIAACNDEGLQKCSYPA